MSSEYDIEIRILSDPRYLCVARAAIGAAVEKYGFSEDVCGRVMLAVDEAVTNVMRHGYDGNKDQPIWIKIKPVDHGGRAGFTIVIEDRAKQVDPSVIHGRDLNDIRPGGLGVHIIRQVMDDVQYAPREGGGMRLLMSKTMESPQPQTAQRGHDQ